MQTDPTKATSSFAESHPGIKRPFSQQASPILQSSVPSSSKVPRVDNPAASQPFSASRRTFQTNPVSQAPPPQGMQYGRPNGPGKSYRQQGFRGPAPPFGGPSPAHSQASGSSKRSRGKQSGSRFPTLDGPLRDAAYIVQEFNKSTVPLKDIHRVTPKASLGNFGMIAVGSTPDYTSKEGMVDLPNGQKIKVWRWARHHSIFIGADGPSFT